MSPSTISELSISELKLITKARSVCRKIRRNLRQDIRWEKEKHPRGSAQLTELESQLDAINQKLDRLEADDLATARAVMQMQDERNDFMLTMEATIEARISEVITPRIIEGADFTGPYAVYNKRTVFRA